MPVDAFGLRVNPAVCFSTAKDRFSERTKARQLKILRPLAPLLRQFMEPGEEILLAARGCSPFTTWEFLTTGWIIYYLKRCILVFTTKRILHLPTSVRYLPKRSIAQIPYGDIVNLKLGSFLSRALTLTYLTSRKERFNPLERKEYRKLKSMLNLFPRGAPASPARERHHLCPKCMGPLREGLYACPTCRLEFKSRREAIKRSLLYPGGGYFYTHHPVLGALDAIVETLLLVRVVIGLIDALSGQREAWIEVALFGILLGIEKALTICHALHAVDQFLPAEKEFATIRSHAR